MSSPCTPHTALGALGLGLALVAPLVAGVLPVSPGEAERVVEVASACPTFSWSGAAGAVAYELAIFDLDDEQGPVLQRAQRIDGAALSWTPARDRCLTPGRAYAWVVRADLGGGLGDWSAPRRFRVSGTPSLEEVGAALTLLERWRAAQAEAGAAPSGVSIHPAGEAPKNAPAEAEAPVSPLVTGVAAIRGEILDATGNAYGVVGVSHSTEGAGVVARNESPGPDLVLDGEAQGQADTLLSESGIDRPSPDAVTFDFRNSGPGTLTLLVDGLAVETVISAVEWSRLVSVPAGFADGVDDDTTYSAGSHLELVGTQFNVLDGPGSGLEVDTLDGLHAGGLQARVLGVCPAGQPLRGINADGSVVCDLITPAQPVISTVDDPTDSVGVYSSIALGADGLPVISHYNVSAGTLRVVRCNDPACAGADEAITTVDDPANDVGAYSSIAVGGDGLPVVSYQDATAGDLWVAKCDDPACAPGGESLELVDDSPNVVGHYSSIALAADGFPIISYQDRSVRTLWIAKCGSADCSVAARHLIDDPANSVGSHTSIALGANGFPVISYYDETDQALKVARCVDTACASGAEILTTIVDLSNDYGTYSSIAVDAAGLPVISFYDAVAGALKVAKCGNVDCTSATVHAVDDPANFVGTHSAIALGADGFPVISYYDNTAGALKVAKCNDPACAGGDETITTVDDPANNVGTFTSIVLGAEGLPLISYFDVSSGNLKVAKCRNPSCRN